MREHGEQVSFSFFEANADAARARRARRRVIMRHSGLWRVRKHSPLHKNIPQRVRRSSASTQRPNAKLPNVL